MVLVVLILALAVAIIIALFLAFHRWGDKIEKSRVVILPADKPATNEQLNFPQSAVCITDDAFDLNFHDF
jgi:flagellar basal body-associated protein FliL